MGTFRNQCRPGVVLPAVLLLVGIAEMVSRLIPASVMAFRGWEALTADPGRPGPFEPGRVYVNDRSYGDLASLGNRPDLRQYRREVFSTDARGYRNPPDLMTRGPVRYLLLGDSYAVSSGVPDEETLSAQLGRATGQIVYNGAGYGIRPLTPDEVLRLAGSLGMKGGTVIFQYMPRSPPPVVKLEQSQNVRRSWLQETTDRMGFSPRSVSMLKLWAQHLLRPLQDDRWLQNPGSARAHERRLPGGTPMLFGADEPHRRTDGDVEVFLRYMQSLHEVVTPRGLRLLVLLVPEKYAVYGPLLVDPGSPPEASPTFYERLAPRLTAAGVPVLDVTGILRTAAAGGLARGELVYFLDDSHWNAAGIRLTASALSRVLDPPRQP